MPVEAVDMGFDDNGVPLIDPRIFDSGEFGRNPYPYYKIMRDHYRFSMMNCTIVTSLLDMRT